MAQQRKKGTKKNQTKDRTGVGGRPAQEPEEKALSQCVSILRKLKLEEGADASKRVAEYLASRFNTGSGSTPPSPARQQDLPATEVQGDEEQV